MKNPKGDFGSTQLMIRDAEILWFFWDAKINEETSRSGDINESEPARVVKREMLWSSCGCIRSMKVT